MSSSQSNFRGVGDFGVLLRDGNVIINAGCGLNGSLVYFGANPIAGCPIGATVYVAIGDINPAGPVPPPNFNDFGGIGPLRVFRPDDMTYWEVPTEPTPAVAISPSYPGYCQLYSAPPSTLRRPVGPFDDETLTVYGNIQSASVREYALARYRYAISYNPLDYSDATAAGNAMRSDIVPGQYDFLYPQLRDPTVSVKIPVIYRNIPEGYGIINGTSLKTGFRFTRLNGLALPWSADGYVQMDPRLPNTLQWEGNGIEIMFPTSDVVYFSVMDLGTPLPGSPNRAPAFPEVTLFPGFTAPSISRVLLPSAIDKSYTIPPRVVAIAPHGTPGKEGVAEVTIERAVPTSAVSTDYSQRRFQMPVRFVDTYAGWASVSFPAGTPASAKQPSADPDKDGYNNQQEWLFGSNPMLASSHPPAPPLLAFVQGRAVRSTATALPGHWETKVTKADVVPPVTYEYEYSSDLQTWRTIGDNDPDWLVINDADPAGEIKVQSKSEQLSGGGFLRVKMTQEPDPATTE